MKKADFYDSQIRHLRDAHILFSMSRFANADHLYGFSAECGLKGLMLKLGMGFDSTKDMPSNLDDRKHIEAIWDRFEVYRSGYNAGSLFAGILSSVNPFVGWHASDRYANEQEFSSANVEQHKLASEQIDALIKKARLDGIL